MHHLVLGRPPEGYETDHINRNGLDNRRSNLRFVTRSYNNQGKKYEGKTSQYTGVSWYFRYKKWVALIRKDGKLHNLGYYEGEEDAARAYNEKALELYGSDAKVNKLG
jgi:HNH endonuclease/AP2 domain